jgi:hypothetical protein
MRLLVGIMHCIENEFNQCIESIESQTYTNYDYFVVEGLPNKEAHNELYRTFQTNKNKYDLFVKIDADMVLARTTFFAEVVDYFHEHPNTDDLQIAVQDFFTNRLIFGLHVYSKKVKWRINAEKIFVDWLDKNEKFIQVNDGNLLAPAALHCPAPSKFQAFHFGLHKSVKITQYDREDLRYFGSCAHWDNILEISKHFQKTYHLNLALAIIGTYESIKQKLTSEHIDFDNENTLNIYAKVERQTDSEIRALAKKISLFYTILPENITLQLILLHRNLSVIKVTSSLRNFVKNIIRNNFSRYKKQLASMITN